MAKPPSVCGVAGEEGEAAASSCRAGGKKKCPARLRARLVGSGEGEERKTAPVRSKASRGFEIAIRGERRVRGRCLLPVGT